MLIKAYRICSEYLRARVLAHVSQMIRAELRLSAPCLGNPQRVENPEGSVRRYNRKRRKRLIVSIKRSMAI